MEVGKGAAFGFYEIRLLIRIKGMLWTKALRDKSDIGRDTGRILGGGCRWIEFVWKKWGRHFNRVERSTQRQAKKMGSNENFVQTGSRWWNNLATMWPLPLSFLLSFRIYIYIYIYIYICVCVGAWWNKQIVLKLFFMNQKSDQYWPI